MGYKMARLVLHERNRPYVVKVGDQELHLCACGLSKNKPYCDGTHKKTLDEKGDTYLYDEQGNRVKVTSFYKMD
jgi:CDGSH-type Zn-finger protein